MVGGAALSADAFVPVTDDRILARLEPAARGKVLQTDLRSVRAEELGSFPDLFRGARQCPSCSSTTSA